MPLLWMITIGIGIGALARLLTRSHNPGGAPAMISLGVLGAVGAGMVFRDAPWDVAGDLPGALGAVVGAALVLIAYRTFPGHAHLRR